MALRKTQINAFFGSLFAIIVLVVFAAIAAAVMGKRIPGLSAISDAMGIGS
ncbi:MAG: hypothetical protein K1Y02_14105 [Candidatus Hydrogenedentes bacterium]|nr:hypothetical protein [Candidatus Hydrogenedentota bacterium]